MSATRDLRSNVASDLALYANITVNGTDNGAILDTADYDSGIMFNFAVLAYTDGTYTITLYESDDSGMAGQTAILAENLIGLSSSLVFGAATPKGASMATIGIVGTKRYVRATVVATAVTTGAILFSAMNKVNEILPVT